MQKVELFYQTIANTKIEKTVFSMISGTIKNDGLRVKVNS